MKITLEMVDRAYNVLSEYDIIIVNDAREDINKYILKEIIEAAIGMLSLSPEN